MGKEGKMLPRVWIRPDLALCCRDNEICPTLDIVLGMDNAFLKIKTSMIMSELTMSKVHQQVEGKRYASDRAANAIGLTRRSFLGLQ